MSLTDNSNRSDASDRFDLLELDLPAAPEPIPAPAPAAATPVVIAAPIPATMTAVEATWVDTRSRAQRDQRDTAYLPDPIWGAVRVPCSPTLTPRNGDRVLVVSRYRTRTTAVYLREHLRNDGERAQVWAFDRSPAMRLAPPVRDTANRADGTPVQAAPALVAEAAPVTAAQAFVATAAGQCLCSIQTRPLATSGRCPDCNGLRPLPANFGTIRSVAVEPAATVAAAPMASASIVASRDELVGGQGSGLQVGWAGEGERTRGQLAAAIGGLATLPASKASAVQAIQAVRSVASSSHTVQTIAAGKRSREDRGWIGQWTIASRSLASTPGAASGAVLLTVTVDLDNQLRCEGDEYLARQVRAEYDRRCEGEIYQAAEITRWAQAYLYSAHAVRFAGLGWYLPPTSRTRAEPVVAALREIWGDWSTMPVATTDEVRANLASALVREADAVLGDLAKQRETLRAEKGPAADITPRAAGTVLASLRKVGERTLQLGALLGPEHVAKVRAEVLSAIETVLPLLDDTSQRGALIWEEIEAETARR